MKKEYHVISPDLAMLVIASEASYAAYIKDDGEGKNPK